MIDINELIEWLQGEKMGYLLDDKLTWVNYGDPEDKFPYNEEDKIWELSRNRMIDKVINYLKYKNI